jgi:methionyl-tRNA formyltransferase
MDSFRPKILFFGTPEFAVPVLQALLKDERVRVAAVITQPDRPSGRGHKLTPPPIKSLALENEIPVFQPQSIRKEFEALEPQLSALGPFSLGVVVAFGQILPSVVLSFPKRGCVNLHGSILPRWRGAAPMQRAIMAQDSETGMCLMQMDEGLDTGAVLADVRTPLNKDETLASLHDRLSALGASLLTSNLSQLLEGSLPATPQPDLGITYASKIKPEEAVIAWSRPALEVSALIRGISPFPGAYTFWKGLRLKVFMARAEVGLIPPEASAPGTIMNVSDAGLVVSCGAGSVLITELQLEGKRRMDVPTFLRGIQITPGERLKDKAS